MCGITGTLIFTDKGKDRLHKVHEATDMLRQRGLMEEEFLRPGFVHWGTAD